VYRFVLSKRSLPVPIFGSIQHRGRGERI
jgi:hypothetical protein